MQPALPSDSQLAQSMQEGVLSKPFSSPADAGQLPSQGAASARAKPAHAPAPAQLAPASSYKSPAELLSAPSSGKVCSLAAGCAPTLCPLRLARVRTTLLG